MALDEELIKVQIKIGMVINIYIFFNVHECQCGYCA
jgi:hypothetical protein